MEYKLSSFQFSPEVNREQKNEVIKRINSIRSRCPSDASFSGSFSADQKLIRGEVKILFSKGSFFASHSAANVTDLMNSLLHTIEDQIAVWKQVRFDQPKTFIDYSEWMSANRTATGS